MCRNPRDPRSPDERWRDQRESNDQWLRRRRQQNDSLWPFLARRQPAGQEHAMCKSPEPDTSPEAQRRADTWFREKRRSAARRTGRGWPLFTALPRAVLRRLTPA